MGRAVKCGGVVLGPPCLIFLYALKGLYSSCFRREFSRYLEIRGCGCGKGMSFMQTMEVRPASSQLVAHVARVGGWWWAGEGGWVLCWVLGGCARFAPPYFWRSESTDVRW